MLHIVCQLQCQERLKTQKNKGSSFPLTDNESGDDFKSYCTLWAWLEVFILIAITCSPSIQADGQSTASSDTSVFIIRLTIY